MIQTNERVAIFSKPGKPELAQILPRLIAWLKAHNFDLILDKESSGYVASQSGLERNAVPAQRPELAIVLGGDGTLLAAARAVARAQIPILAVNLGALGFLSEVALDELYPTLEAIREKRCAIESRAMLHCQVLRNNLCIAEYDALNDVVVGKGTIARMADFDVHVDGGFVSNYKADGVILSTPTGSTAYSLAAGGPILAPNVEAFVITPVSPHALTNRPLVIKNDARIKIVVKAAAEEAYLTVDGQIGAPLREGDSILCYRSEFEVQLMRMRNKTFFDVLRAKLKWGER